MNDEADFKSYPFPSIVDEQRQGILRVFKSENIPFEVKRVFSVVNAKMGAKRGQHAHKQCNQLICCIAGEVNLICDDGESQTERLLSPRTDAIWVPCGVWAEQDYQKDNSMIIVFCDQDYDESDYIRNYEEFLYWKREKK